MLRLQIQKLGFVPLEVMWDNAMAEVPVEIPREYTITMEPGSAIGGIVQDEQGQPVVGARVHLSIPSTGIPGPGKPRVDLQNFVTNTDAGGRWQCDIVHVVRPSSKFFFHVVRPSSAAHNAVRLAGESPVVGIDCLPSSHIRRWLGATRPAKARM